MFLIFLKINHFCNVKWLKLLVLCLLLQVQLSAQSLEVRVFDGQEPLIGVSVRLPLLAKGGFTNEQGILKLEQIQVGFHELELSYIGYENLKTTVEIKAGEQTKLSLRLRRKSQNLEEFTVTGTLSARRKSDSPVPVEIFSRSYFKQSGSVNLLEGLQRVNGVLPVNACNVCQTAEIRINGMAGPYTLVLIDGMPIVSALSSVYGFSGIPVSMVERVEVVKGPAATLYGSEAVAGIINIITLKPNKAPRLLVDYQLSSYREQSLDLALRLGTDSSAWLISANAFEYSLPIDRNGDGFRDIPLQQRLSLFSKWEGKNRLGKASMAFRLVGENRMGGQLNYSREWMGTDSIYGEGIQTARLEWIGKQDWKLGQLKRHFQYSWNYHDQYSAYGTTWYLGKQQTAFIQDYGVLERGKHEITNGLALRFSWYDDNSPVTSTADGALNKPAVSILPGVFIQDEFKINPKNTLVTGLRLDYFGIHGPIFSPRINYRWKPDARQTLRLSGGNGFRVVNLFTEDHAALTGARTLIIKEELKPEQSWNLNLNYSRFFSISSGFLNADASLFSTWFSNRIIADYDTDPRAVIYQNLDEHAVSRGLSMNLEAGFSFPLKLSSGFTWMDVYSIQVLNNGQKEKRRQLHAPEFSGNFQASLFFKKPEISLDISAQFTGPMRLPVQANDFRPNYSPFYTLGTIQLLKTFDAGFEFAFGCKNIFNFIPQHAIMRPFDPFNKQAADLQTNPMGYTFDPSYAYAPLQGRRWFLGLRYSLR